MIDEIKRKAQRESEVKDLVVKTLQECMGRKNGSRTNNNPPTIWIKRKDSERGG